ncbi:transcriptional regulator, MarR family [Pacificibacter marinus]|uniref:Transcriptional regulator SlyA n=2 Tax=Pacificibacter marinus TaxID=658057 RepID=A0A1Y5R8T2_9RHOB|nr:transcriptional regulator, MarR family [Pacificibacter marinus]SLN11749.1 Transcriptional regulator SlyA [Pacificibacter marinus]
MWQIGSNAIFNHAQIVTRLSAAIKQYREHVNKSLLALYVTSIDLLIMTTNDADIRQTARSLPIALLRARETVMGPYRDMLAKAGVSEQKWRILRVLIEGGPMEQTSIADGACLLLPSLTRILSSMEKEGLVTRATDTADRRKTIVTLAPAGTQVIAAYSAESRAITVQLELSFGKERLDTLLDLLEDLNMRIPDING